MYYCQNGLRELVLLNWAVLLAASSQNKGVQNGVGNNMY